LTYDLENQEKATFHHDDSGADPGFQVRGVACLNKIAPSGGRRENIWGINFQSGQAEVEGKCEHFLDMLQTK
jgi:hypothetical protein